MNLPNYIVVKGIRYDIDTDYRIALRCIEIIEDDSIGDYERALAIMFILFNDIPEDAEAQGEMLSKAIKYLQCGQENKQPAEAKDMDFEQDSSYIYASFMSDYHIDLENVNMHWWRYIDLIAGLTDSCVLNRVRDLRNYDLSDITDLKQKEKIMRAKKSVALKVKHTEEEMKALEEFEALFNGE